MASKKAGYQPKVSKGAGSERRELATARPPQGGGIWGRKIPAGLALLFLTFFPLTDPSAGIWPGAGIGGGGRRFLMVLEEKKKSLLN